MAKTVFLLVLCIGVVAGCRTISDEAKADLAEPVDCETAAADIAELEGEKASTGKQVASGVRMILPVAAVAGILGGDYGNRASVASGKYNDDIDAKIAEIKQECGLSP